MTQFNDDKGNNSEWPFIATCVRALECRNRKWHEDLPSEKYQP
jgi:hypothetical protein